jgi:hypothetical protein
VEPEAATPQQPWGWYAIGCGASLVLAALLLAFVLRLTGGLVVHGDPDGDEARTEVVTREYRCRLVPDRPASCPAQLLDEAIRVCARDAHALAVRIIGLVGSEELPADEHLCADILP